MNPKTKLRIVFTESILSAAGVGFCIPIMTLFWNSVGMNQTLIGISQMMFTVAILFCDIPMGYIADKYSRKTLNIIGGLGMGLACIIYALSQNFWIVVLAEILQGIFMGMTNGVDRAFLKFYSDKIDDTGKLFVKNNARLTSCHFIGLLAAILIGMFITKFHLRLVIGFTAVPYLTAGFLSFFIDDIGDKIKSTHSSQFKDMLTNIRVIFKKKDVNWLVYAYALTQNITHPIIWVFTPFLIAAGVPVYLVGLGWIFNYLFSTLGTFLARKTIRFKPSVRFIIPIMIAALGMLPIIINVNMITVWFFALTGLAQGFPEVSITSAIQQKTEDKYQTTIVSIATTIRRFLYIPLVSITNWAGSIKPEYTLIVTLVMILPLAMIVFFNLRKYERQAISG